MCSCSAVQDNLAQAESLLKKASEEGAVLVVLPEMFPTLAVENGHIQAREKIGSGPIQDFLSRMAKQYQLWIVGGTIPIMSDETDRIYAACLIYNSEGECVGRYDKIHLFDACLEIGKEEYCESKKTIHGKHPLVIETPWGKLGIAVCYDIRFPELFIELDKQGAHMLAIPAAFVKTTGTAHWEILCRARAIEHLSYVIAANQTGKHCNGRCSFGHSMIINPWGEIVAEEKENIGIALAEIDLSFLHESRKKLPVHQHRKLI